MTLAAGVLTGCASSTSDSSTSLELWLPPFASGDTTDEAAWDNILADFEAENDVDVNVTIIPWSSYEEKYLTGISSGAGPDVGYMYTEMMGDYLTQGAIVPMDDYFGDIDTSKYLYLEQGQLDGEQVAMPFVIGGARILYYNKALLAEAGIDDAPVTWDDFTEDAAALIAAGITPTAQAWGDPDRGMLNESFFPLLWQAGGDIFSDDGTTTAFNSDAGIEAATYLLSLKESGAMSSSVTSLTTEDAKAQFAQGKVAFFQQADAQAAEFADAGVDFGFVDSLTNDQKGTFVASDSLVLLDKCADKQLCTDLIGYITSATQMAQFHEIGAYPPITTDEAYVGDAQFENIYSEADMLHSLPIVAGGSAVYNSLYKNLQQMILGQKTPAQALEDAAAEGDIALSDAQ